jgi:hypothetical protein
MHRALWVSIAMSPHPTLLLQICSIIQGHPS